MLTLTGTQQHFNIDKCPSPTYAGWSATRINEGKGTI